ncbi:MAG: GMC family oxidoreductase N-terminal domain-containing protein, partial [Pseudomonadales bacterium]|nr:GMC family oxidoreductase N-terminal domain-containing protein [Pseudomonadales bacterium]
MHDRSPLGISLSFETLIAKQIKNQASTSDNNNPDSSNYDYDIIIIGSGYGGSIAASELSGLSDNNKPLRICLLERGSEYLPGMFPSRMAEIPAHVRINSSGKTLNNTNYQKKHEGLFDLHISPSLNTLVANGLGGGSLINAGVMVEAKASVFDNRWPSSLQNNSPNNLYSGYYEEAKQKLGAKNAHLDNTIERHSQHQQQPLLKHQALKNLAIDIGDPQQSKSFSAAPLTIAMEDKTNNSGVMLDACNLCGDCTTGCNHNAKESLDTNLLVNAWRRGVEIYTGATVLSISPGKNNDKKWLLSITPTK